MTRKLIGLVGYKGSGKSSLIRASGIDVTVIGFSDPIVSMLSALGVPSDMMDDKAQWDAPCAALNGQSIRHAAQTLGTEWGRKHISSTIWVDHALRRAQMSDKTVVIENVRFPNEYAAIVAAGGICIGIDRPGLTPDLSHESEQHIGALTRYNCYVTFRNVKPLEQSARDFASLIMKVLK